MTAILTKDGVTFIKTFTATVLPWLDDAVSVELDAENLDINGHLDNLRTDLDLPSTGAEGTSITWSSNSPDFLTGEGELLQLSQSGSGKQMVVLTATITKGDEATTKTFEIYIAEDEAYSAYLFAYFTGNGWGEEAIRFALSHDGFNYRAVNENQPIISSAEISVNGGVRDPHILRGNDDYYYMVVTDLQVAVNGWNDNKEMVFLRSDDLVNWTHSLVNIPALFPEMASVTRCWAPQTVYDEKEGKYMVYWSMLFDDDRGTDNYYDKIYYAYTDENFTTLVTKPQELYFPPNESACIDGDIIYFEGQYHLFHKTEGTGKGIMKAVSDNLTSGYELFDKYLDQTDAAVEGSSVFRLINSDRYILMYDMYTSGTYQFAESTDLVNFFVVDESISMNFTPRHGTVIPITPSEARRIASEWGGVEDITVHSVEGEGIIHNKVVIDNNARTIFIEVEADVDISRFSPELITNPGTVITPESELNFTDGAVTFNIAIEGVGARDYTVTVTGGYNAVEDFSDVPVLTIYPNPVDDLLNIFSEEAIKKVRLYSLSGQLVVDQTAEGGKKYQLDISHLKPGTYLLKVNGSAAKMVVVE